MATKQGPPPPVKLPSEVQAELENLAGVKETLAHNLEVLKKLGVDTKPIEERLEWAEEARKMVLSEFGT